MLEDICMEITDGDRPEEGGSSEGSGWDRWENHSRSWDDPARSQNVPFDAC